MDVIFASKKKVALAAIQRALAAVATIHAQGFEGEDVQDLFARLDKLAVRITAAKIKHRSD